MIRISHLSGSLKGKTSNSGKTTVRIGRAPDCDIRFDAQKDPKVSNHHAEFLYEDGQWFIVDTGSTNGTIVGGKKVMKARLKQGEEVQIGAGGPTLRVEFDQAMAGGGAIKTEAVSIDILQQYSKQPRIDGTQELKSIASELKISADTGTANLAELAAKKVAEERAKAGGQSSGQTMQIMVNALKDVNAQTKTKTRKKWVKIVGIVGGVAAVVVIAMGVVIWLQQKKIDALVQKKLGLDKQIASVQAKMDDETDPEKLVELEQQLNNLSASAVTTLQQVSKSDKQEAAKLANAGDDLDKQIRDILAKFDAQTYVVPPIFKQALKEQIDTLEGSSNLKYIYHRKMKYWPMITKEFQALGLPEEMAYIAWAETQFDPKAKSGAGAAGMWQFTADKARDFHITPDDRYDPEKETHAAAQLLANLLAEYGSDSFMLAMASYNRGEAGVRRVLHQIAQEPGGFRKEKRDFWHLYRLKKLPEETRDYVPRVLAAAIVSKNAKKLGLEGNASDD